ncbi:MAG: metallophosphoesterase family protein [Trueperaceae bacterium]
MRYLLLSDVHGNVVALKAVLADARRHGYDAVAFLGDAVGYYPAIDASVRVLADLEPAFALIGNHDAQLLAFRDGRPFDDSAGGLVGEVLARQAEAIDDDALAWLRTLVRTHQDEAFEAVHGALARPWQYLHGLPDAEENLPYLTKRLCLVGHTHVPRLMAAVDGPEGRTLWRQVVFREDGGRYRMPPKARGFFNPGSVGQPRDGVPYASYGLFDVPTRRLEVVRVPFDVTAVQRDVRAAEYPEVLAERLAVGR